MTPYIGPALRGPTVKANTHISNIVVNSPPTAFNIQLFSPAVTNNFTYDALYWTRFTGSHHHTSLQYLSYHLTRSPSSPLLSSPPYSYTQRSPLLPPPLLPDHIHRGLPSSPSSPHLIIHTDVSPPLPSSPSSYPHLIIYTDVSPSDHLPYPLQIGRIEERFSLCGVLIGIVCFPLGLLCCLMMRDKYCTNCGASL